MDTTQLQRDMKNLGVYDGAIDGLWGPLSEAGYRRVLTVAASVLNKAPTAAVDENSKPAVADSMAWGKKVSQRFKERIIWTAKQLEMPGQGPDFLMACIAFETGESFDPAIRNGAGSGATGLIQFMPSTARGLGTTTDTLARMSAEDQINFVYRYFVPYKGRLKNLGDVYMAILWPAGIGKSDDWELWARDTRATTYLQNRGLDVNKDGVITRGEAVSKVEAKLLRGRQFYYG